DAPPEPRLRTCRGAGDGPDRASRRPPLRPGAACAVPERPGDYRRRLRPAYGVSHQPTRHLRRRRAARRLPPPVPVPRPADRAGAGRGSDGTLERNVITGRRAAMPTITVGTENK